LREIQDIFAGLAPWIPVIIIARLLGNVIRRKSGLKTTPWHEIGAALLFLYTAAVFTKTIPIAAFFAGLKLQRILNLIPFREIGLILRQGDIRYILLNVAGNIAMFVPIGFLVPLLWYKAHTFTATAMWGLGLSLFIEVLQFFIGRGTDIDDLILNTAGAMLGYLLYLMCGRLSPTFVPGCRTRPSA
jgi:glycopeptide antibiotics resistance protein